MPQSEFCRTQFAARCAGVLALGLALAAGAARAADGDAPAWTFGGFGSLGMVHSNEDKADFTSSVLKATGAGYSNRWSGDVDSRLGAQLGVTLNKQWSGVLQVISEQRLDNTYTPIVEWFNIKYQATPELALRFGRIALPMFLAADYRKVGYAYPWVRTPVEVYGAVPISNSDGADLSYRWNYAGVKNVVQAFYGRTTIKQGQPFQAGASGVAGISNTSEYGAASVRVSLLSANMTVDLARPLFDAFRQFGPQGAAIADRYDVDHKRVNAVSIGASYDPGQWFAIGEIGHFVSRSFLGETTELYASAGYRFDSVTPYLSYARAKANSAITAPGLTLSGLPPPLAGAGAALNAGLNSLLISVSEQATFSAGLRWDMIPNAALKLQVDRVSPHNRSRGTLINLQPGFRSGRTATVASVVLDFVF